MNHLPLKFLMNLQNPQFPKSLQSPKLLMNLMCLKNL